MSENLLVIDKKVLPDVFEKVINVKNIKRRKSKGNNRGY